MYGAFRLRKEIQQGKGGRGGVTSDIVLALTAQEEVHPCWLIGFVGPAVDRASLDAHIPCFHVDFDSVVENTIGRF